MEHKPGPEMDALIAEKVFGLVLRDRFTGEEKPISATQVLAVEQIKRSIPKFSTDISAAWKVVDKLNESTEEISLTKAHGKWCCHVKIREDDLTTSIADSAPMAICLAALSAKAN